MQQLAAELVKPRSVSDRSPLLRGVDRGHIGALCDALINASIDPAVWSAKALVGALNADMKAGGWSWPDRIDNPAGFMTHRLRRLPAHPPQQRLDGARIGARSASGSASPVQCDPTKDRRRDELAAERRDSENRRWYQAVVAVTTAAQRSQLLSAHAARTRAAVWVAPRPDVADFQVAAFATIARRATFDHPSLPLARALELYVCERPHHRRRNSQLTDGERVGGLRRRARATGPELDVANGSSSTGVVKCGCGQPGRARPFIARNICDRCWDAAASE